MPQKKRREGRAPAADRKWMKKDLCSSPSDWSADTPAFLQRDMTPAYIFELFFDDEVINYTVTMTNLYAMQKGKPAFSVTPDEVRGVLAILMISGYVQLPSRRMFWENTDDVHNPAVSSIMSVNRFEEILRYLHFADNKNLAAGDKMAKVRPLYSMLNERFLLFWPPEQELDVDESMIPYYGKHSAKQFIRGKPIRFGFKLWCLNTRLHSAKRCGQIYTHFVWTVKYPQKCVVILWWLLSTDFAAVVYFRFAVFFCILLFVFSVVAIFIYYFLLRLAGILSVCYYMLPCLSFLTFTHCYCNA